MKLHSMVDRKVSKTYHVVDDNNKKLTEFSSALDAEKAIELVEIVSVDQRDVKRLWEQIEFEVKDLQKRVDMHAGEMEDMIPASMQAQYNLYGAPMAYGYKYEAKGSYRSSSSALVRLKTIRDMMFKIYFGDVKAEVIEIGRGYWAGFNTEAGWTCGCGAIHHQLVDWCIVCKYKRPKSAAEL